MKKRERKDWTVLVRNEASEESVSDAKIKKLVKSIMTKLDTSFLPGSVNEISILFVNDSHMKQLNSSYRKKNKTTDVLSFSQIEGEGTPQAALGDIVISLSQAKKQARKFGNNFNGEIVRLIIHGILHLLGYDHENVSEVEIARMRTVEDLLFEMLRKNLKLTI